MYVCVVYAFMDVFSGLLACTIHMHMCFCICVSVIYLPIYLSILPPAAR